MGKKLTVYMIDGTEYGPRFCEIGNWVGKAIYSQRSTVNKLMPREEMDNPGVYFLKGDSTDDAFEEKIYIGEAENIRNRIRQHINDPHKEFNELIFFISKDELLTKTQIKYLESRLIQIAVDAKTAQIENNTAPSTPTLHEADISDMEYFLEQIKLILPLMGFRFLISSTVANAEKNISQQEIIYQINTSSYKAKMIETDMGYIVLKGSEAKKELSNSCTETYRNMRRKLVETNVLSTQGDKLIFNEDAVFNSASSASNMVLGRNSNGHTEWVTADGKSFREIQNLKNS